MLLFVKSNFIVNNNKMEKFKYFNVSSILPNKKQKLIACATTETKNKFAKIATIKQIFIFIQRTVKIK
jgi:hypothetical protein